METILHLNEIVQKKIEQQARNISFHYNHLYSLILLTTHIQSLDITTFDLLNFRKANPVGIRAGNELQNGFGVAGSTTTSNSSSTRKIEKINLSI